MKDLKVTQSFPYSLNIESVYDYTLNGLTIENNDSGLFSDDVKKALSS